MNPKQIATGSIFGALIGDAAGATLEFLGRRPERDEFDVERVAVMYLRWYQSLLDAKPGAHLGPPFA